VRAELGITIDEYVILSTGRLAPQKGLRYLVDAVPVLLPRLGRRAKVLVAGEGPARADLESRVRDLGLARVVQFLGFRNDVGDLLEAADMVVIPSLWEGLSVALLEAMAAQKPIVTTAIGSNVEVTDRGASALLVPPRDSVALADAILQLAYAPEEAERLARTGRSRYLAAYTEDRMLAAYLEQYRELLRRKAVACDN
jgi:glycosyltransferase involved in cell wall biosynthesis